MSRNTNRIWFKHKGNHYATLPWFGTKIAQKHAKRIKQKHKVLRFSSRRETPRFHVLNFRATSGHNVLYMRDDVSKEISRFRLPASGQRRLLLKVPIKAPDTLKCKNVFILSHNVSKASSHFSSQRWPLYFVMLALSFLHKA